MRWYHKVDPQWLAARKGYLCASDIERLLPTTPTGRARANLDLAYLTVWAEKHSALASGETESYGAAARGHVLEPYAVAELNEQALLAPGVLEVFHWDDAMVTRNGISCSPDALSLPRPNNHYVLLSDEVPAIVAVEIKSYAAAAHYATASTPKEELSERWQLATAFYVMPTLEEGALVFYNPSAHHPLFIKPFVRADLASELETIDEIRDAYDKAATSFDAQFGATCATSTCKWEETIVSELEELQSQGLNP